MENIKEKDYYVCENLKMNKYLNISKEDGIHIVSLVDDLMEATFFKSDDEINSHLFFIEMQKKEVYDFEIFGLIYEAKKNSDYTLKGMTKLSDLHKRKINMSYKKRPT